MLTTQLKFYTFLCLLARSGSMEASGTLFQRRLLEHFFQRRYLAPQFHGGIWNTFLMGGTVSLFFQRRKYKIRSYFNLWSMESSGALFSEEASGTLISEKASGTLFSEEPSGTLFSEEASGPPISRRHLERFFGGRRNL